LTELQTNWNGSCSAAAGKVEGGHFSSYLLMVVDVEDPRTQIGRISFTQRDSSKHFFKLKFSCSNPTAITSDLLIANSTATVEVNTEGPAKIRRPVYPML